MMAASSISITNASPSPQSRRAGVVSSPWTQVVRGESESESGAEEQKISNAGDEDQHECSENNKLAWKKPSNGGDDVEVGPVMDAMTWPDLRESTKASPKSASSDSLKNLSQGAEAASSPHKQAIASNPNPNSTPNCEAPTHHRSIKSNGMNSGFPQPPPQQLEIPHNDSGKVIATAGEPPLKEHSLKEAGQRGGFGSQSHNGSDHQHQRNSFKRGNGGPHPRGDGSYHHNYGGRRDQDRGNQDWNPNRNFGNKDTHMHQRSFSSPRGGYVHPQSSAAPFIPPPPVPMRPFGNPVPYPEVASPLFFVPGPPPPESLRVPIIPPMPPHAMFFPAPDPQLPDKIVSQIDYYFSIDNLIKDTYLRQNMDDQGWVPIKLIAGFKKVKYLTDNIHLILDSLRKSTVVEVQGDKVRKRNDWVRWLMHPVLLSPVSSPQPHGKSSHDILAGQLQYVALEDKNNADVMSLPSGGGDEGTSQATVQIGHTSSK